MALFSFIISCSLTIFGVSGFIAFLILENYPGAVLAIASGIVNGALSHLHFLNFKHRLREWYTPPQIDKIGTLGYLVFACGTASFVYFLVVEIYMQKPIMPISDCAIIPLIWGLICAKSGLFLKWYAVKYSTGPDPLMMLNNEEDNVGSNSIGDEVTETPPSP